MQTKKWQNQTRIVVNSPWRNPLFRESKAEAKELASK